MTSATPAPARTTIRWGILGCGDVTEVKSGPGFQKSRDSQLVAVMRRNGALAADYAQRHGVPRSYDDARALVNDGLKPSHAAREVARRRGLPRNLAYEIVQGLEQR